MAKTTLKGILVVVTTVLDLMMTDRFLDAGENESPVDFQGKEPERSGSQNDEDFRRQQIQDYGFRLYQPAIGKFLSRDPLFKGYPMLTPYQFASNTPIAAIDLDGLEAFFVLGAAANQSTSWLSNPNSVEILRDVAGNSTVNTGFDWEDLNGFLNNQEDRSTAALRLAIHVLKNMSVDGEDITLIGHSHGGNVSIQAVNIIKAQLEINGDERKVNLITIGTPAYNGEKDPENPGNSNVDSHLLFYNTIDIVQTTLANIVGSKNAERTYKNSESENISVDESPFITKHKISSPIFSKSSDRIIELDEVEVKEGIKAHSFHTTHPEIIKESIE